MTHPFGIDVSKWQANKEGTLHMDWNKAKAAGIQFAFVRASRGNDYIDPEFDRNWSEQRRLSILRGAYHFFRPSHPVSQIQTFFDFVQPQTGERLALDLENNEGLFKQALTEKVRQAVELVKQLSGRYPLIYSRALWLDEHIDMSKLPKLDYWLAQYYNPMPPPFFTKEYPTEQMRIPRGVDRSQIMFHQTSEKSNGKTYGAQSYYIDTDRFLGTDLLQEFGNTLPIPAPIPAPVPVPTGVLNVPLFSQNDLRWKNVQLGTSDTTIGWNGCLISDVAMILAFYGKSVTPAILNQMLMQVNGYDKGNLFVWSAISRIWSDITLATWIECRWTPAPLNAIDTALARGEPCIVWVDFNPVTAYVDMHWVVVVGKKGTDDYWINDPWNGLRGSFKEEYGSPARWIFRIASYGKKIL